MQNCPSCSSPPSRWKPWVHYESLTWFRCRVCRLGFLIPYLEEARNDHAEIARTYARYGTQSQVFRAVATEKAQWILREFQELTLKGAGPSRQVIEVGPGTGAVALELKRLAPEIHYLALDSNPEFVEKLQDLGVEASAVSHPSDVERIVSGLDLAGKCVIVFMDNVLEHWMQPAVFLEGLLNRLPVSSRLLIEVPNERGIRWRARLHDFLRGAIKPPTFPGHIHLFTSPSLRSLFQRLNFSHRVWRHPLRETDQIRYLMQSPEVPPLARWALRFLKWVPVDRWLGVEYWLRASVGLRRS